ncbi:hypothetical protein L7F22_062200 [Adiantum nelumboides]|nr:hypothetical protein [Adiantum nelumboides]
MASLSHPQLSDCYTHKACKEASSNPTSSNIAHHMQGLYSLMHSFNAKYPQAGGLSPHHDHYNIVNAAKPYYYGSSHVHGTSSGGGGSNVGLEVDQPSSFLSTHASSTLTSCNSLDSQVSSLRRPAHKQAAMDCKTPLNASPQLAGGELHVNAANKKRIRAVMDCKDLDKAGTDAKKRTKLNVYQQQNTPVTVTEMRPTITNVEKLKAMSPLKKHSITDQKSPDSKSNISRASSPTLDQESPSKADYIHVRARRGQATDSHSLAERVRREKISERMKYLQDLVPSCIKVTGKAMMLDEIINYVQSLQRQVEFLSMKLAAVPPSRLEFSFDDLFGKKAMQPSHVNAPNTNILRSDVAEHATLITPPTNYAHNIQSAFLDNLRSNEVFPENVRSLDVNSSIHLQTSNHEMSMACSTADQFFASLPSVLGVDDPLVHHNTAGSTSCSLVASPANAMFDPTQQLCISQQGSQLELEWDDDLHNIVQQMGCFNSQANTGWLPSDNLLTEGFFLQGNPKEEL